MFLQKNELSSLFSLKTVENQEYRTTKEIKTYFYFDDFRIFTYFCSQIKKDIEYEIT
jgi:hypothetical protein